MAKVQDGFLIDSFLDGRDRRVLSVHQHPRSQQEEVVVVAGVDIEVGIHLNVYHRESTIARDRGQLFPSPSHFHVIFPDSKFTDPTLGITAVVCQNLGACTKWVFYTESSISLHILQLIWNSYLHLPAAVITFFQMNYTMSCT